MPQVIIPISGIIARFEMEQETNVTPTSLQKSLDAARGQDILVTINSPGGNVWEGLEMFSKLKNYSGNVETRVISLAASMGSILALAGNKKSIENTAMYYIHNAQGGGVGDYRKLAKIAQWLKDLSTLLANLYAENTTMSVKEAKEWMDAETQFFGNDLEELGFEVINAGEVQASLSRVEAIKRIAEVNNKIPQDEFVNDLQKVAASIAGEKIFNIKIPKVEASVNEKYLDKFNENSDSIDNIMSHKNEPAAGGENNKQEDVIMTLDELKAQHPDLYNQIFQAGVDKERSRVLAHLKMGEKTGAMESASKFIAEGKSVIDEEVHAEYFTAGLNKNDVNNRNADDQDTGTQPTVDKNGDENIDAFEKGMSSGADLMLDDDEEV